MPYLQSHTHALPFKVRRSARVKRLQMIHRQGAFEVVSPLRKRNAEILRFVWEQKRWMTKQVQRHLQQAPSENPFAWPSEFMAGEHLPYRGERLALNLKFSPQASIQILPFGLQVAVPFKEKIDQVANHTQEQLMQWYQQQAMALIKKTVDHYCPLLGRWPLSYQLKKQKTRWGSCGKQGKIYINWVLVLAPPGVLEYVVVHELCHLFYRNHGKRFWAKVAACMPDYRAYDKWLTKHGAALMPH